MKELANIPSKSRLKIEKLVFTEVYGYSTYTEIPSIKKIRGFNHYYRIRVGDYRIGVQIVNDELIFERVLHRKEIYKRFP